MRALVSALPLLSVMYAHICVLSGAPCRHPDMAACFTLLIDRFMRRVDAHRGGIEWNLAT